MDVDEEVMISIVNASEMFKKQSSAILRQYGLTFSHYNVLKQLVSCGHGRDTVGNLSKKMVVTSADMAGIAKRMEKAGLVKRKNDAQDARLTIVHVTQRGRQTLGVIREIQEQHGCAYLDDFPPREKERILSVLEHIVQRSKGSAAS